MNDHARRGRRDPLAGMDLAIFDKDGTLIDFHLMWSGWVRELARGLEAAHGRSLEAVVYPMMGVDPETGRVYPHGALAATAMVRLRDALIAALIAHGLEPATAESMVATAWHSPDPLALARPLADLRDLFTSLLAAGTHIAIATSDDREPTERTLEHLGISDLVEALACADDGRPVKPSPDAVHWICRNLQIPEARTAVIGDAPADLRMARSAGVGLVIGVLTGVGDERTLEPLADLILPSIADLRAAP
ncbi:MAG: HAD family hydrolase [Chloroflexi bacterium]|nr:HAD family hydrolase [Chloroflexota bacterium]